AVRTSQAHCISGTRFAGQLPTDPAEPLTCGTHALDVLAYADCVILAENGRVLENVTAQGLEPSWRMFLYDNPREVLTIEELKNSLLTCCEVENTKYGYFAEAVFGAVMRPEEGENRLKKNKEGGGFDYSDGIKKYDVKSTLMLNEPACAPFKAVSGRM